MRNQKKSTNNVPAMLMSDFYKISHRAQYPEKTETVYATWTARTSRMKDVNKVVCFGLQGFIKRYLVDYFNENFFNREIEDIKFEYSRIIKYSLGQEDVDTSHIEALHKLGYLPLKIMALPEGTLVPTRVPMITIENTEPEFFWLTNYIETIMSCSLWQPMTSATIALEYRKILEDYARKTSDSPEAVPFQGHDFSMRGMSSLETAMASGSGHLLSFTGTDTIPAIHYLEDYYNTSVETEFIAGSIPATEHSVQCCYGQVGEMDTFKRLITEIYPKGLVSIVSDTWDYWKALTEYLPKLKDIIMMRDGKLVIRGDSGDPVKITCGDPDAEVGSPEYKGSIELLWEVFGGKINSKGYKELDSHIGFIYGDAITIERCKEICRQLREKGFASTNITIGVGSFSFQLTTRDTFGMALKTTYAVVDGEERFLFKDPKTDNGVKKSQKGMVCVYQNPMGEITYMDELYKDDFKNLTCENLLTPVFINGFVVREETLQEIRKRVLSNI